MTTLLITAAVIAAIAIAVAYIKRQVDRMNADITKAFREAEMKEFEP